MVKCLRMNTPADNAAGAVPRVGVIAIVLHRERNAVDAARGAQKPLMSGSCSLSRVEIDRSGTVRILSLMP